MESKPWTRAHGEVKRDDLTGWDRPAGIVSTEDGVEWYRLARVLIDRLRPWRDTEAVADAMLRGTWPDADVDRDRAKIAGMIRVAFGQHTSGDSVTGRKIEGPDNVRAWLTILDFEGLPILEGIAAAEQAAPAIAARKARPIVAEWLGGHALPDVVRGLPAGVMDRRRRPKAIRNLKHDELLALAAYALAGGSPVRDLEA